MLHFSQSGHFPRHRHLHFPPANHVATRLTPNQTSHEFLRPRDNIAYNKPKQLWILPVTWQYGLHQTKSALNSFSHVAKWLTPNQTSPEFFQSRGNMANKANQQCLLPATWRLGLRRSKSGTLYSFSVFKLTRRHEQTKQNSWYPEQPFPATCHVATCLAPNQTKRLHWLLISYNFLGLTCQKHEL